MRSNISSQWLRKLGYADQVGRVFVDSSEVGEHPYANEIGALLDDAGDLGTSAVVCVEHQPTLCLIEIADASSSISDAALQDIRNRIWNQGLVSIILVVSKRAAQGVPVRRGSDFGEHIAFSDASDRSHYSWADVASGDIQERYPNWFDEKARVDQRLLGNLASAVAALEKFVDRSQAQFLLGQAIFVSYLEHRGIVGATYRAKHRVGEFRELVTLVDRAGLTKLLSRLKTDLNGDILPDPDEPLEWRDLPDAAFVPLADFLSHTNIQSGQQSLWPYDFRYIPVELLSGIYETFLSAEKDLLAAFYTPRHLAVFTVALVLDGIADPTQEVIYDGACGSGILLTTAFRRILRFAEMRAGRRLSLDERTTLLRKTIRGSDISEAACRVTAFSLYLALLEDLDPPDIERLRAGEGAKLPKLRGQILHSGEASGDFFSPHNPLAVVGSCSIIISNPPWKEPKGQADDLSYEHWLATQPAKTVRIAHRQIAMAYAHKANRIVRPGGRVCLVLPSKAFVSRSSQSFLKDWLGTAELRTLVNFSDLRRLLFPAARHPCMVACAVVPVSIEPKVSPSSFNYWVPKADISLAFGRLTVHGSDRHRLSSAALSDNNQLLRVLTWGSEADRALIAKLQLWGKVTDLTAGPDAPWQSGKGFHHNDRSRTPFEPTELQRHAFFPADNKPSVPVLHSSLLVRFPSSYSTVASIGGCDGQLYKGPRVVFPDGADSDSFEARAFYSERPFSFQSSVGAIGGSRKDADLLRFLAAYLRSSLARYFLLHTSYSLAVERERLSMQDVGELPFTRPLVAQRQQAEILAEVAQIVCALDAADVFDQERFYEQHRERIDELMFKYFGLTAAEQGLVFDTVKTMVPSVQPSAISSVRTAYNGRADLATVRLFARTLQQQLRTISVRRRGDGAVSVHVMLQRPGGVGPIGICAVRVGQARSASSAVVNDQMVESLLHALRERGAYAVDGSAGMQATTDLLVVLDDTIYLIKPLISRFWLRGQANRAANQILCFLQQRAAERKTA